LAAHKTNNLCSAK